MRPKVTGSLRSIAVCSMSGRGETKGSYPRLPYVTHLVEGWQSLCGTCVHSPCKNLGHPDRRRAPCGLHRAAATIGDVPARLTALDSSFLHLEDGGAHMHVAAVMTFDGPAPAYDDLVEAIVSRLHLVPRYRQRLAFVPLGQGRPRWVDDPHFNPTYHIRHAALPAPGSDDELKRLAARIFGQRMDRSKPLWEIMLVEGLAE